MSDYVICTSLDKLIQPTHPPYGFIKPFVMAIPRVRAQQVYGDAWAKDPGCYLTEAEILENQS